MARSLRWRVALAGASLCPDSGGHIYGMGSGLWLAGGRDCVPERIPSPAVARLES